MADERSQPGSAAVELIDRLASEIHEQTDAVETVLSRLSVEQRERRPSPKKWSVAEHLQHMAMTNEQYLDVIEPALERARARGLADSGELRESWMGRQFVKQMAPPTKMRIRTFSSIRPTEGISAERARASFSLQQDRVLSVLEGARGVDIGRSRIRSPFLFLLQMTVAEGLQLIVVHNRRHLWNISMMLAEGFEQPEGGGSDSGPQRNPTD